jgi:hypothetical protein
LAFAQPTAYSRLGWYAGRGKPAARVLVSRRGLVQGMGLGVKVLKAKIGGRRMAFGDQRSEVGRCCRNPVSEA